MEIKNNKPVEGSEPRRFSAGRAAAKPAASSFASVLKKAASDPKAPIEAKAPVETTGPLDPKGAAEAATAKLKAASPADAAPASAANPESKPEAKASSAEAEAPADPDAAFADHMDLVRFRLKTGYYASKAINDALSDKLSGYFDELA